MLCMLSFKSWHVVHVFNVFACSHLQYRRKPLPYEHDVMSLSALAPVVIFPCHPGGFKVMDYHGRSSAAVQAASQRLLLPLPVDAACLSRHETPRSLFEELETFGGERHASLPAFQPGAGLLQLRRDRARIQRMHGELQPSALPLLRKLPLCDLSERLAPPISLAALRHAPESCISIRQPVRPHCIVCLRSLVMILSEHVVRLLNGVFLAVMQVVRARLGFTELDELCAAAPAVPIPDNELQQV